MRRRTFLAGLGFAALQLAGCAAKPQTTPDYVLTYADKQANKVLQGNATRSWSGDMKEFFLTAYHENESC